MNSDQEPDGRIMDAISSTPAGVSVRHFSSDQEWLAMRKSDVTASAAGALFGIHPYQTALGLWALKSGLSGEDVNAEPDIGDGIITFPPAARGHLFERPTVQAVRMMRPDWHVVYPLNRYWSNTELRIGATPDALAIDPSKSGFGVIQVKTVASNIFRSEWIDPETKEVEVPTWILLQTLVEATLTGASWACVAVLVSDWSTTARLIECPIRRDAWDALTARVADFWTKVKSGSKPEPDYGRDARLISALYRPDAQDPIELSGRPDLIDLLAKRAAHKKVETTGADAEKSRKAVDAEIIHKFGNHSRGVMPDGAVVVLQSVTQQRLSSASVQKAMGRDWVTKHSKPNTFTKINVQERK